MLNGSDQTVCTTDIRSGLKILRIFLVFKTFLFYVPLVSTSTIQRKEKKEAALILRQPPDL